MALRYWNGFEDGVITSGPGGWSVDGFSIISNDKASGSYAAQGPYIGNNWNYLTCSMNEAYSEGYLQFRWKVDYVNYTEKLFAWRYNNTTLGGIKFNASNNRFELFTGDFATLVGTGQNSYSPSLAWVLVELYIKIHDTSGQLILRVNGTQEISFSGNTQPGSETAFNVLRFFPLVGQFLKIDDFIFNDTTGTVNNSWPGGGRIIHLRPNADTSTEEWSLSSGSDSYALVDEETPSGVDYLLAESTNLTTMLELQNKPIDCLAVKAVIPFAYAQRGSDNPPTSIILGIDIDGSQATSSSIQAGLDATLVYHVIDQHPQGGSITPSHVDTMKLILRSAA